MKRFDAATIVRATAGTLLSAPRDGDRRTFAVETDTRRLRSGSAFLALRGSRFDGHDYLDAALAIEETGVIGERDRVAALAPERTRGRMAVGVDDSLRALGDLAAFARREVDIPVIGLTGSAGKTTTKEFVRHILERTGPGLATKGNFNNLVGLPLTLLDIRPIDRWIVLEMGMNAPGEIARLAEIARPTLRLITNIGMAHTEGLGSIEGVAEAKGELFASAQPGDILVKNLDDPRVAMRPVPPGVEVLGYGRSPGASVRLLGVHPSPRTTRIVMGLGARQVDAHLRLPGEHNAFNALAAAALAHALNIDAETIVSGLEAMRADAGRSMFITLPGPVEVIDDTYNANPLSMKAALRLLAEQKPLRGCARGVAVLGDMLELGTLEGSAHEELGRTAAAMGIDCLLTCGHRAAEIAAGAKAAGMPAGAVHPFEDSAALSARIDRFVEAGDLVLVKGSRGARMEVVVQAIREARGRKAKGGRT